MLNQQQELQNRIESLSDFELIRIINFEYEDYREDALLIAKEELKKRNINSLELEVIEKNIKKESRNDYAGFWLRFFAHFIDEIFLSIVILLLWFINVAVILSFIKFVGIRMNVVEVIGGIINFVILISIHWLYHAIMESSAKQATIGKILLGIIVTDMEGNKITFGKASARYWSKIISGIILNIGYIMAGFTEKKQALHDTIAGCLVIKK